LAPHKCYFLATTSLEEFWDTHQHLLFLGEWCLKFDRRSYWITLDGHLIKSYVHGGKEGSKVFHEIDDIYEKLLPIVATSLNAFHETEFSVRYWRIVIGPWLQYYITVMYDRYLRITLALKEYPNLTTTLLSEDSFIVSRDTEHFVNLSSSDFYNLQVFSRILRFLGKEFPSKSATDGKLSEGCKVQSRSWKNAIFRPISDFYRFLVIKLVSNPVVINSSYWPKRLELRLAVKLFGGLFSTIGANEEKKDYQFDDNRRKTFKSVSFGDDVFCNCIGSMLFADMPKCFVEGYKPTVDSAKSFYPNSARIIFSANAWWFDETFKVWAAEKAEKGTLLFGAPHGGNYSAQLTHQARDHEKKILDHYYLEGLSASNAQGERIQTPLLKLMPLKDMGASNLKSGILWATTSLPRYFCHDCLFCLPEFHSEYLQWQARFVDSLSPFTLNVLKLRPHSSDFGWGAVSRLKVLYTNLRLDPPETTFIESISNCRLFVCDHMSTTYAEALACNKPTILFWSPDANPLLPEAEQYFALLRNAGVLFDSPEAAAEAASNVYEDVEKWWNDAKRQETIKVFTETFLGHHPDSENIWLKELCVIAK